MPATYCTAEDLERYLSSRGVTAFADHDGDDLGDDGVVDEVIDQASAMVRGYLKRQYVEAQLGDDVQVKEWTVTVACYKLCLRRGNPPPESLAYSYEQVAGNDGILAKIANRHQWPGRLDIDRRKDLGSAPAFSNLTVDRRHPREKVRVTEANSSRQPTDLERDRVREAEWYG